MMFSKICSYILISCCFIVLVGCTHHVDEKRGVELQVVPVTYTKRVKIQKNNTTKAQAELVDYLDSHWEFISTQNVNIIWYSNSGRIIAEKLSNHLITKGISKSTIFVNKADNLESEELPFDLEVNVTAYKTVVPVCDYLKLGNYGEIAEGCYPDSARWQSMVHPENMLTGINK